MKLSPRQAAAEAQVSPALIYQWCGEGLPHYRLGGSGRRGKILIDTEDLRAFVESRKVSVPAPLSAPKLRPAFKHVRIP